jgi:hypothetical protein
MTEIAEAANWGQVYNQEYAVISNSLQQETDNRGIILPYTHEAELYSPPNTRIFQIVSLVTPKVIGFIPPNDARWSKALGMLSIRVVAVKDSYNPGEMLIFPTQLDGNQTLSNLKSDMGFSTRGEVGNYKVLQNKNSLPITYVSNYYVFYDDIQTLGHAFDVVDFANLPVFIEGASGNGGLTIPTYVAADNYTIYAVSLTSKQDMSTQSLIIDNSGLKETVELQRNLDSTNSSVFTATERLEPNDHLTVNETSSRLFAIRQTTGNISYTLNTGNAEDTKLTVTNALDYAVVSQYLYTNLTHIQNNLPNTEVQANVLYKAWIIKQTNSTSGETTISIGTQNLALTFIALGLAIAFSYLMLLLLISPFRIRVLAIYQKKYLRKK